MSFARSVEQFTTHEKSGLIMHAEGLLKKIDEDCTQFGIDHPQVAFNFEIPWRYLQQMYPLLPGLHLLAATGSYEAQADSYYIGRAYFNLIEQIANGVLLMSIKFDFPPEAESAVRDFIARLIAKYSNELSASISAEEVIEMQPDMEAEGQDDEYDQVDGEQDAFYSLRALITIGVQYSTVAYIQ